MQSQNWTEGLVQVLDTGTAGSSTEGYNSQPCNVAFGGTAVGAGSPGQCLISISNYNFYNAADPKNLMPTSINWSSNYRIKGGRNLPMLKNEQFYGKSAQRNLFGLETLKPRMRKRLRTIFTNEQVGLLEAAYSYSKYPDASVKRKIASELDLPVDRIQVWFQNKRTRDQKCRKKNEDKKGDIGNEDFEKKKVAVEENTEASLSS